MDGTAPEPTNAPTQRRLGREGILIAARQALETADLDTLIPFLGPRPLARAAGLSPGTITHHFDGGREIAEAVIDDALASFMPTDVGRLLIEAIEAMDSHDHASMFELVRAAAHLDFDYSTSLTAENNALYLACIVAPNDERVRMMAKGHYDSYRPEMAKVYASLAAGLGRRFDTAHGFTPETITSLFAILIDGFLVLHRFDPDRADPNLYAETALRLFDAATIPLDESDVVPVEDRLVAGAVDPEQPDRSRDAQLATIARHGVDLYQRVGWEGLRMPRIATLMGVRASAMVGIVGGRSGLADLVWRTLFFDELAAEFTTDVDDPDVSIDEALHEHQRRLARITHEHPRLSAAMVRYLLDHAARTGGVDATTPIPQYMLLLPHLDTLTAAQLTHGVVTGALLDRGPTEKAADRMVRHFDIMRTATQ